MPGGATPCLGAVPCSPLPCSAAAGAAPGMLLAKAWLSTRSLQCCAPRSWHAVHPALGCAAHPISPGCTLYPCCAPEGAVHPSGGMPRRTPCVPPGFGARKRAQGAARHLWARLYHGAGPMEHRGVTWAPYLPFQHLPAVSPHGPLARGAPIVPQEGSGRWDRTRGQGGVGKPWWGQPRLPAAPSAPGGPLVGEGGPGGCWGFVCAAAGGFRPFFVHSSPWRCELAELGTSLSPARDPALPRQHPSPLVNHLPAKLAINSCPCSLAAPWPGWHVVITGPPPPGCPCRPPPPPRGLCRVGDTTEGTGGLCAVPGLSSGCC